ncbi:MAG: hypothetical protein PHH63_08675 [Bacteroidales bacterium]|nr:hypothetical protein [Bacteroidales bacterium]MDD3161585.1 hypothetical protein [Bacteroidales bacterium]
MCKSSDFKGDKEKGARKKELSRVIVGLNDSMETSAANKKGGKTGQLLAKMGAIIPGASKVEEGQNGLQYTVSVRLVHLVH